MKYTLTLEITPQSGNALQWKIVEKILKTARSNVRRRFPHCEYDCGHVDDNDCFEWATLRSINIPVPMLAVVRLEYSRASQILEGMGCAVEMVQGVAEGVA